MRKAPRRAPSRRRTVPVRRNLLAPATEAPLEPVSVRIAQGGSGFSTTCHVFTVQEPGVEVRRSGQGWTVEVTFKKNSSEPSTYPIEKDKSPFDEPQIRCAKGRHQTHGSTDQRQSEKNLSGTTSGTRIRVPGHGRSRRGRRVALGVSEGCSFVLRQHRLVLRQHRRLTPAQKENHRWQTVLIDTDGTV